MGWKELFSQGKNYLEAGLLQQAEQAFEEAYLLAPNEIRILEEQVNVQRRAANMKKALHISLKMVQKFPSEWKGYFLAGRCHFDLGELENARSSFAEARKIFPSEQKVIEFQSGVARKMGDINKALQFSFELIESHPEFWRGYFIAGRYYLEIQNPVQAMDMFSRARALSPNTVELIEYQCIASRKAERYDLAEIFAQELIAVMPHRWQGYCEAGLVRMGLGDCVIAVDYFDQARKVDPNQFKVFEYQANAYWKIGVVDKALDLCVELIAVHPSVWRSYFLAGKYALEAEKFAQAQMYLARARELAPDEISLIEYQAGVCRKAGAFADAYKYAEEYIRSAPGHWRGYYLAARYLVDMSQPTAAAQHIAVADRKRGKEGNFDVLSLSSEISKRLGNREEAFAIAKRMVLNDPSNSRALYLAGVRALDSNRIQEGIDFLNEASSKSPMFSEPVIAIINSKIQTKKLDEALEECQRLLPIDELAYWKTQAKIQILTADYAGALSTFVSGFEATSDKEILRSLLDVAMVLSEKSCIVKYGPQFLELVNEEERHFYSFKLRPFLMEAHNSSVELLGKNEEAFNGSGSYLTSIEIEFARRKYNVYTMPDKVPGFKLYQDEKVAVYVMEGISHAVRLYTDFSVPENSYFYVMIPHYVVKSDIKRQMEFFLEVTKNRFALDRLVVMANSFEDLAIFQELGATSSFFCNHNCWLDFNLFVLDGTVEKIYDLVINTRPEKNMKRPYLAAKVNNLAVIRGALVRHSDYWPLEQLAPRYMNNNGRLQLTEVVEVLNKSYCGGIFSEKEGACYSSSEYLLCGLPVISTQSSGGRDYWYDSDNSIIVDANSDSVAHAVETAIRRLQCGDWSSEAIRFAHVQKSLKLRDDFVRHLGGVFKDNGVQADPKVVFDSNYRNQFKTVSSYPPPQI